MILPPPAGSALPIVKSFADCIDWNKAVSPYIPQLSALPQQVLSNLSSLDGLKSLYVSTNPLIMAFAISLALAPIFLVVSEVNKNYSQVDRVWSLLPTLYNAHYNIWARMNGLPMSKLDHVLLFSSIWSARLTFNYWRKGGYQRGSEDYRWEIVKSKLTNWQMFLFNVTFISLAQSYLLFSVTTPTYVLLLASRLSGGMTIPDYAFAYILLGLVFVEWVADGQQWTYYGARGSYRENAKVPAGFRQRDLERGFNTTGLFHYSRHPNFAAEQSIWVLLYQWACYETGTLYNWTVVGPAAYLILFQSSTYLTEGISAKKYPEYKVYQQRVGKFLPNLTGGSWSEYERKTEKSK